MNGGLEPIDWWEGEAWEPHESWERTLAPSEGLVMAIEDRVEMSSIKHRCVLCMYMSLLLALLCKDQVKLMRIPSIPHYPLIPLIPAELSR
jgi:hypothetical protein